MSGRTLLLVAVSVLSFSLGCGGGSDGTIWNDAAAAHDGGVRGLDGGIVSSGSDAGASSTPPGVLQDNADAGPGAPRDGGAQEQVPGDPTGSRAVSAFEFLNSLGICTHVGQGIDDPAKSAQAMSYVGLRNLRDDGNPGAIPGWLMMHQTAGIRVCPLPAKTIADTIDTAKKLRAADALLAVEGPNEPNNFAITYEGQQATSSTSYVPLAHFQRDLYAAVKAEPSLAGVPVFHTSEAGGSEPDNVGLQFLTIPTGQKLALPDGTKYADFANVHNYVCGHSGKLVDNVAWNASDPTLNGDWDSLYVEYGTTWAHKFAGYSHDDLLTLPRVTTETGWVTQGAGAITQEQQGRVFLDLYLSAFSRGFKYTFIYMLRDDPSQGIWGVVDVDYKPKKSGTYLHNLTTILADDAAVVPGALDFSIAEQPATVHSLLLQKSSGIFELVVWDERHSGGSDQVTVDLTRPRKTVRLFDPTVGTTAMQTLENVSSVALMLTDHPVILEYDPRPAR
jgi:hypothetical protein